VDLSPLESDADVVNAVSAAFFTKSDWNLFWNSGKTILVRPKWETENRTHFSELLDNARADAEQAKDQSLLNQLKAIDGGVDPDFLAKANAPSALKLKPPMVVSNLEVRDGSGFWMSDPSVAYEVNGKQTTVRTPLRFYAPPSYSGNGQYAALEAEAPEGPHSATLRFFLKSKGDDWIVVCAQVIGHS
jgi:hypothetical protein